MRKFTLILAFGSLFFVCSLSAQSVVSFETVAEGLQRPVGITHAGDGSRRLFVTELGGRIRVIASRQLLAEPFLDITNRVTEEGEGGLWDVEFHPRFRDNGRFFVAYATGQGGQRRLRIGEYSVDPDNPNRALPTEKIVLNIPHPEQIHFGGDLEFGPDGMLYISSGDGSSDPEEDRNAQNLQILLGKILRINVETDLPFIIPSDNPLTGRFGARGEIWAWGFRNPYRMAFSPDGRLFVGDVGAQRIEEIDIVVRGGNYGWSHMEGPDCFPVTRQDCEDPEFILPIHSYGRSDGAAVLGGMFYRGPQTSRVWGDYIFADFISRRFWSLREEGPGQWSRRYLGRTPSFLPAAIGQGEDGEFYVSDLVGGRIHRVLFRDFSLLAQVAVGDSSAGPFSTNIHLLNDTTREIRGDLFFFDSDGEPLSFTIGEETESEFHFTLPPESSRVVVPRDESGELRVGWAAFVGDGPIRASALFQQFGPDSRLLAQAGVDNSRLGRRLVAPAQRDLEASLDTGIAVVNPWPADTVEITLRVVDAQEQELASMQFTLEAQQHRALFLSEIGVLPQSLQAKLVVDADREIAATVLLTANGVVSASLP
ncbi:MAG TPA: PQQ-dependent sugar dehydrogenase [Acidobacteriota bacterium]|nr:PQQ-dependent sugar dehydrogenase [Acidobacteriota bacterium]